MIVARFNLPDGGVRVINMPAVTQAEAQQVCNDIKHDTGATYYTYHVAK